MRGRWGEERAIRLSPADSRLDIRHAFRDWFDNRPVSPLTGLAIEVDTSDLPKEDASSSAFIYQISLREAE